MTKDAFEECIDYARLILQEKYKKLVDEQQELCDSCSYRLLDCEPLEYGGEQVCREYQLCEYGDDHCLQHNTDSECYKIKVRLAIEELLSLAIAKRVVLDLMETHNF